MSSKYELTISSEYVKNWGLFQAIREFFQNSTDEEIQNPDNKSFFSYDSNTQTLSIGNKSSVLNIDSLLLGVTTKTDDSSTIGQFGEGYKIATMVLLRTNHPVTFYNYGAKEVWTTKLVKSRRYGGRLVPTFYVDKNFPWQSVPNNDLTITIENITQEEYETIQESILSLQEDIGRTLNSQRYGRILLEKRFKGKIFVSGLYVCENKRLEFGYDITPEYLTLDRDRQTVSDFDLVWHTSRMWSQHTDTPEFKQRFFDEDPYDMFYLDSMISFDNLSSWAKEEFFKKYGNDSIPVLSQEEYDRVRELGGHPVFVNKPVGNCFRTLYDNFSNTHVNRLSPYDALMGWYNRLCEQVDVPENLCNEFDMILDVYEDVLN